MTVKKLAWKNEPACLDEEQRDDPLLVCSKFCEHQGNLFTVRNSIFEIFNAALASGDLEENEAGSWMGFYRLLTELVEAGYLIDRHLSAGTLSYSFSKGTNA